MMESGDLPKNSPTSSNYIGRFAPSPTGPLHMGSLVAALASWLDARSHHGKWLVRMEDLDPPRESKEAADQILYALDALSMIPDEPVLYQSQRIDAYRESLAQLQEQEMVYACDCSRQQIQEHGGAYPGTCRHRRLNPGTGKALRCRVDNTVIGFTDRLQGQQSQDLENEVGDFVILRKDGLFAYQLAVVVDDAFQNITHIVRGTDLMDSTPRQIYLQQQFGLPRPDYSHIPVIVNNLGQKLSKQHMAAPIDTARPPELLLEALRYLQQDPDPALASASAEEVLEWGTAHWQPEKLARITELEEFRT